MAQDFTPADLQRPAQALPEPSTLGQINEFIMRAEALFREGKEFLANLANISTNPALKKVVGDKLGIKPPALPDSTLAEGGKPPQIDYENQFKTMIDALTQFKALKGDISLTQLIEWLQANKESVISGMKLQR